MIAGDGKSCALCHETSSGGGTWNAYGWAIRDRMNAGLSALDAILAVEGQDSDGEGSTNLEEMNGGAQPGWTSGLNTIYAKSGGTSQGPAPAVTPLDPGVVVDAPPVADAGADQSVYEGETVVLDGTGSSDDQGITAYEWDFQSDGTWDAFSATASTSYATAGTYTVTLRVTDTGGQQTMDTAVITVSTFVDNPPAADAGPDKTATVGAAVQFDGSGSTDDIGISTYAWTFGDGGTASSIAPSHTYGAVGTYTVTLTVTDTIGQTSVDTAVVTVGVAVAELEITGLSTDQASYAAGDVVTATATVLNNGGTKRDVWVDFTYRDGFGAVAFVDSQKIRRHGGGSTKSASSQHAPSAAGVWTVQAVVRWSSQTYDSQTVGFDVTPGQASVFHVDAIDFATSSKGRTEALGITVTILDDGQASVSNATVNGTLTLPGGGTVDYTGVTASDGTVAFEYKVKNQALVPGSYTFTVNSVTKAGSTYDSAANGETTDTFVK
jgi:PKD repeat protein